ncbi:MAG: MATE family efflux transporter [Acholeplasmataceae bacterium]|nr:MATE family efflux transporter [Acholeplasmataceae bacterium]
MENAKRIQKQLKKQQMILESPKLYKSIIILALPIFLSNFMKAFNDLIDMYFASTLLEIAKESAGRSAITIPTPVFNIASSLAIGIMTAGAAMMAQYLGAKKREDARKVSGQLLVLCIIVGALMNLVLYLVTPSLMQAIGAEGLALEYMIEYVRIRSFEMIPLFAFFAFQATRTASGDTVTPFILNIIMIITNIVSTYIFMKYYNMEVTGAAYGTLLGNVIIMPIFIIMMFKGGTRHITITLADIRLDFPLIRRLFNLAWPAAISQAFTSIGFLVLNAVIISYGLATVDAFQVGNKINSMILMPAMGVGSVTATFVGQNIGARNTKRAHQSVKSAMILANAIAIIGAALILPIRELIIKIFLEDTPESMALSVEYMFFILTGLPLMSIFQVFMGAYQGSGETMYSLILSAFRLWLIRIPLVVLFKNVLHLPASAIWYAMIVSNFASAYLGTILYCKCKFQPRVKLEQQEVLEVV